MQPGIGIENIWYRKKVSVSVSFKIMGTVTHCFTLSSKFEIEFHFPFFVTSFFFFLLSYCWVSRNWLRLPHFLFLGHSFRQVSCSLFFSCSFSNPLLRRIGLRATSVLGGLIATIGLGLSSLVFKVIIVIITIRALPSSSSSSED